MLAIVCPGQGSQTPGFLTPWLELDGVREQLTALGQAAGLDLVAHGTESDADTIKDTAVAQPLIVAAGLVTASALFPARADVAATGAVLAGHSVGELTATALAGVVTDEQAISLVATRGRAMAQASAVTPTGMAAVLGGDPDEVLAALDAHGLTPANINGAGQVVAEDCGHARGRHGAGLRHGPTTSRDELDRLLATHDAGEGGRGELTDGVAGEHATGGAEGRVAREQGTRGDEASGDDEGLRDGRVLDGVGVGLRAVRHEVEARGIAECLEPGAYAVELEPRGQEAGGLGALTRAHDR